MSLISEAAAIIFKSPFKQEIGKLEIDILDNRDIVEKTIITSNPVESGTYINDHAIDEPTEISFNARISKFSLNNSKLAQLSSLAKGKIPNRLKDAHDELYRIKEEKEPILLITKFRAYENMFLTYLNFPSDAGDGEVLKFAVRFQQLNIVESQLVSIPNSRIKIETAQKQSSYGKQTAKPLTPSPALNSGNITFGQFLNTLF
jgi:hypothetical protein